MRNVEKIPAKVDAMKKIRIAAYCRVSKNESEQMSSLNFQIEYFKHYSNKDYETEVVKIYYDCGKSGLRKKSRIEYQNMFKDAKKGNFDYILTKSISRFSRNTVDILSDIRWLRELNVYVYFEKENIDTMRDDYELILTIYGMLSQEESRDMSENVKWGIRTKMKRGVLPVKIVYGYKKSNENLIICESKANIVKLFFREYLDGRTLKQIKKKLEELNVKSPSGKDTWDCKTINNMISNEKYMGNVIHQKTFIDDFLLGTRKENRGELEKVIIKNNHDAIISKSDFMKVQELKQKRSRCVIDENGNKVIRHNQYSSKSIYSNLLVCGHCGTSYRRRVERGKVVYRCGTRMDKGRDSCPESITIKETYIENRMEEEAKRQGISKNELVNKIKSIEVKENKLNNIFI